jgi:transposase InsO family protein
MPWRTESVMQQRVEFVIRARSGKKAMSELCREYGVSRPTGYLWLKRYEETGSLLGLQERSRRPHHSPGRTQRALEELVLGLRDKTGWGAAKLQEVLHQQKVELGRATVHRILVREGRVGEERRSLKKATKRFAREQCNELAQMDFKGEYQLPRKQKCYPLSLLDDCSRYLQGLWPLSSTAGEGVHRCLEGHFKQEGVPQAILMDHGTPWFSTQNQHGLTWVAVWLIEQGVVLKYSGIGHPQTQGKVERFHKTLKARTKHRGAPATMSEWLVWAEEFRREYNYERPHESLNMKTPAQVYRAENLRPYQEHPREWEYGGGTVKRLDGYGMLYYRGGSYFVCEALGHKRVRIDQLDDKLVVTFRHLTIREIDLRTSRSIPVLLKV